MKQFVKEWWFQIVLLVVIIIGIGTVQTQQYWAPRVYGEYMLFKLRHDGLGIVPKSETLSAAVADGATRSLGDITFQLPWSMDTIVPFSTTTALGVTNADGNKIVVYTRGDNSYAVYNSILSTTPADAQIFGPTSAYSSTIEKLAQKKEALFGIVPIYRFETNNNVRGFESPVTATSTAVMLFTPKGKAYEFVFGNVNQGQIDETLQSIKEAK